MIPQVTEGVKDIGKFQSIVKLTAFSPFKSGVNALENINAISEGIVHEDLKNFLEVIAMNFSNGFILSTQWLI